MKKKGGEKTKMGQWENAEGKERGIEKERDGKKEGEKEKEKS